MPSARPDCLRVGPFGIRAHANRCSRGRLGRACKIQLASVLLATAGPALSQATLPKESTPLQRVEIPGRAPGEDRRDASAAKLILTREEIQRFGDSNLGDVLQRIPSITVTTVGGQAREIRLRGLGNGYTQLLIDGQPLPKGASFDTLSPELIERIEVIRSASADMSTQAIAGSINVVMRRAAATGQRGIKLGFGSQDGRPSGSASLYHAGRDGTVSYSGTATLKSDRNLWPSTTDLSVQDVARDRASLQQARTEVRGDRASLAIAPRLAWQPQDMRSLVLDSLLQLERYAVDSREAWQPLAGEPLFFPLSTTGIHRNTTEARVSLNWKSAIADDGRVDLKLVSSLLRRSSDSQVRSLDALGRAARSRDVTARVEDASSTLAGNYASTLADEHTIKLGWDGQLTRRNEDRVQRESSATGLPTKDLDEGYTAEVRRVALFLQDDWILGPGLSAYIGIRWEQLHTRTRGNVLADVSNRSSTVSPILQLLWKLPGSKSDQARINLSRTYKSPTARELIPRRWVETDNSATAPDFQGNPDLRPELAWGLDLAYENYVRDGAFLGVSGYVRRIDNVVRDRLFNENGTWVTTPTNGAGARAVGIEIEAKGKLALGTGAVPPMAYRLGWTRNWSHVDDVPGPGNRLQQPLFTATAAIDFELPSKVFGAGGSFAFERHGSVRTSSTQSSSRDDRRTLDLYGVWRFAPSALLRLTLANLLAQHDVVRSSYSDATLWQDQTVASRSARGVRLLLEADL